MNCIHCKKTIPEESEFCSYCGVKVMVVPESWKCPQCSLDVPEGTKTCPNCGSSISAPFSADTHQPKFCKKCGTKQKDGQKFCPKCGEPFFDETGKPYLKGIRKGLQDAKDQLTLQANELSQKGEQIVSEKVQPQLTNIINEMKKTDWTKYFAAISSFWEGFVNDINKIRFLTKIFACIFALCVLIKVGFSVSVLWYVLIIAILILTFKEPKVVREGSKSSQYLYVGACFVLILITASVIPHKGSNNFSSAGNNLDSSKEICIFMKSDIDQNVLSGNYGLVSAVAGYFTDVITIPEGKMWIFKKQEIEYSGNKGTQFHPDICYYNTGNTDAAPIIYNCYTQAREIPVFRGNDKIRIRVKHTYVGNAWMARSLEARVYFVEKDDDLQLPNK